MAIDAVEWARKNFQKPLINAVRVEKVRKDEKWREKVD